MSFPEPEGLVWLDGSGVVAAEARVSLAVPAVQGGLGVFETLAVRGGSAVEIAAHLERLALGARRLAVGLPAAEVLAAAVAEIAAGVDGGFGWLKIWAVRGGSCAVFAGPMDPSEEDRPASAVLLPWTRNPRDPLAGIKCTSYAASLAGLDEARRRGADEGVWCNTRGHLAEGCTSNLFVVWKGKVLTPGLREGILPGIVRQAALRAARESGRPVHAGRVRPWRLDRADEAFLTSSLRGVRPLIRWNGRPVGSGEPGPVTLAISRRVRELRGVPEDGPAAPSVGAGREG